ncbi:hypothetical protein [Nocardia sp. NPDC003963]
MSTDLKAIMDRDKRRRRMLNDPDLNGDRLLFALALDEVIVTRQEQGRRTLKNWVREVTALVYGADENLARYWGKQVVANDFPRYEAVGLRSMVRCVAPMIRRDGPCGKRTQVSFVAVDPGTGAGEYIGLCSRHRAEHQPRYDQQRKDWIANGKPRPPANTGGVLRRYFEADWDAIYQWARPGQQVMEGGREATPPRPTLRLIPGGVDSSEIQEVP